MNPFYYPEGSDILKEVLAAYDFPATLMGAVRYGQGHINDTFCVICQPQEGDAVRYILQGLSLAAFPHPDELMENFIGITSYLRDTIIAAGGDGTLNETTSGLMRLPEEKRPPVGYIPRGTVNDVSHNLGLSKQPRQAAKDIVAGRPFPLDVGSFNDRWFNYVAAFGIFNVGPERAGLRTLIHIIVMTVLFIISFTIQQRWVFAPDKNEM